MPAKHEQPRSPMPNLLGASACFAGAVHLASVSPSLGWAGAGAAAAGLLGLRSTFRAIDAFDVNRRLRRADKAMRTVRKYHGRSRWAVLRDLKRAGMLKPGGFLLGCFNGRLVFHNGEGSAWLYAPPGCGKSVGSVITNLLLPHTDSQGRAASIVVLDVSGELHAVTSRRMREFYRVIAIAPWAETMSRELGIEIHDAGFNMTLPLLSAGREVKDLAESLSVLLLPGQHSMSEASSYFLDFGRSILAWGLMVLVLRNVPQQTNLAALRRVLMSPPDDLAALLADCSQSDAFNGALRQYANKLIQTKRSAPEEWSGAINSATRALSIYDDYGPLGNHVSTIDGFHFSTIKDRPTCVFLMIPPEKIASHGGWLNLALSSAIEQAAKDRTNRRIYWVLDEIFGCGFYCPNLLRALALYRKAGHVYIYYSQTGGSQIRRLYGDDGFRDLIGMCEVIQAFGVRDPETLRMLAELAGQDTIKDQSYTLQPDVLGDGQNLSYSTGATHQGTQLIRPEDIRTLPDDRQIVLYRNLPPIQMDKLNYLTDRRFRKHADPNPYYRKSKNA